MRKLLSWRILFGFLVGFTVIIVSLMFFAILQERSRVHKIVRELIGSVKNVDSTNRVTDVIIDSLANRLSYLSSQVTMLEAQKDSLLGKQGQSKGRASSGGVQTRDENPTPLRRPVFTIVDRNGKVIGKDGISADSLKGMKVMSGTGYSVRRMDVVLGRGTARVQQITGVSGNYDWRMLSSQCTVGDRIVISIKKVVRLIADGKEENVDVGTVLLTVPIRASYQPHFSVLYYETFNSVGVDGIDHTDLRGLNLYVRASSGYLVQAVDVTLMRSTEKVSETTLKNADGKLDLSKWSPLMRSGDRVVIDIKRVTVRNQSGFDEEFNAGKVILTVPIK